MWNSVTECCLRIASHFTRRKSVLVIGMEAREQAATLHQRRELQFSFPTQVQRSSDGEGHSVRRFPLGPEHDEQRREFIKPPANRTATDVGNEAPYRHSSFQNLYTTPGEGGVGQCGPYTYHHQYPPSSSSASLSSQPGYGDEGRGSPRRSRKMAVNLVRPIVPCQTPFSPNKYQQEWSHGLSMSTPSPPHESSSTLPYSSATNALADIDTLPAGCGPTPLSSSERHTGVPRDSQAMGVGGMGAQTSPPHRYEQFSGSPCSPTAESDHPPLYSDVIDNSLYTSVSRPSEQRTKSGKI